jgi:hypothetical protein
MEVAIPLIALGSLYVVTNQKNKKEGLANITKDLPNTNILNSNFPSEYPIYSPETQLTSKLSNDNRYDGGAFTDKFLNPNSGHSLLGDPNSPKEIKNLNGTTTEAKYKSLLGTEEPTSYFQHNNQVPFFGGNLRTRHVQNNGNESILDNYNGTGSQIIHKKEQAPLFTPQTNLQWAFGMPSYSDFEQSRINVSKKMSNVKPFPEQKVAPGLGLGATTEGLGGYNSGMLDREKWLDKTADELRVDNKPKPSGLVSLGREGPAISFITKQGSLGKQEKNRPDTVFDFGPERYLNTTGIEKKNMLIPIPIEPFVTRPETSTEYAGGAGYTTSQEYIPGQYMPSHNQQLKQENVGPAVASNQSVANVNDYDYLSYRAFANNRSIQNQGYYGTAGKGIIAETIAPLLDILRPSRKENSVGTLRPYQNAKPSVNNSYIYNPNDTTRGVSLKEHLINTKFHLNIDANQRGGGYDVTPQQPIHNNRDFTTDYEYIGNSSAPDRAKQPPSYESAYNQRNNDVKSLIAGTGYTPKGNLKIFDANQNVRQNVVNEKMLNISGRELTPQLSQGQSPSLIAVGQFSSKINPYSNIELDRTQNYVLEQLNSNPFNLDINKGSSLKR